MFVLYTIEGTDKSGKETQAKMTYTYLQNIVKKHQFGDRIKLMPLSYPIYDSPSSFLVKEYLGGKFGTDASSINPKMASLFYAVDRAHHYHTEIKNMISDDTITIAISDRYVGSNYIHQGSKLKSKEEIKKFIEFDSELEHTICGIPEPNLTFFLDVPPEVSFNLRKGEKLKNGEDIDIHEADEDHIRQAYNNCSYIAELKDWVTIKCTKNGEFRTREEINREILLKILLDLSIMPQLNL